MAVLGAAFLMPVAEGQAAPKCDQRERLTAWLAERWGEAPERLGLSMSGNVVEVFRAADGSSWSIVATRPDGWACVVGFGEAWERVIWSLPERRPRT